MRQPDLGTIARPHFAHPHPPPAKHGADQRLLNRGHLSIRIGAYPPARMIGAPVRAIVIFAERGPPEMFSVRRIIFGLAAGLMLPLTTGVLSPEAMPAPAGQVLPTVSGDIDAAIHGDAARFGPERLWCSPQPASGAWATQTDNEKTCAWGSLSARIIAMAAGTGEAQQAPVSRRHLLRRPAAHRAARHSKPEHRSPPPGPRTHAA